MAPEIIMGKKYTEKADCYAFGIILWEILTRLEPYEEKEPMQIVVEVVNDGLRPTLPAECADSPLVPLMKDCFPADDTRVLTDHGFLFLDELESLLLAKVPVLYACYDITTKSLQYCRGQLVTPDGGVAKEQTFVNITSPAEAKRWSRKSGTHGDGSLQPTAADNNHVSLLVTGNHRMYACFGNKSSAGSKVQWPRVTVDDQRVFAPPVIKTADHLLSFCPEAGGCKLKDGTADEACAHRTAYARMVGLASGGIKHVESSSPIASSSSVAGRSAADASSGQLNTLTQHICAALLHRANGEGEHCFTADRPLSFPSLSF